MTQVVAKPVGCIIEEIDDFNGRIYRWNPATGGFLRYVVAGFLSCWLCGWAIGWVMAFLEILQNRPNGAPAFLLIWLTMWTIGGIFAFYSLYQLLRPNSPESVTLGDDILQYDSGHSSSLLLFNSWHSMRYLDPQMQFARLMQRRKQVTIPKVNFERVVLERIGERQRLYFDHGADRIEIGPHLREPEREWLAAVINTWKCT